jgi:dynein heavy chain 1, cytosolic
MADVTAQIMSKTDLFLKWISRTAPETDVPNEFCEIKNNASANKHLDAFTINLNRLLLIKSFRPDRFISMSKLFIDSVFGESFLTRMDEQLDLVNIVENEMKATIPILMCSVAGYDASGRVEDLAAELNKPLISIAIGSSEGFTQAEKAINTSAKNGRWVLLKNAHLAPQWLVQLEKKLHNLQAHNMFRIFLAMEIHPKIPSNLIRSGRCFVFEPPPGIKANLLRTISVLPTARMNKAPAERSRLYFLLAWLHAIAQERLRYVPLGWSKQYEFNESDLRCALDTIDVWVDNVAQNRTNLPPSKLPFNAIFTLMSECVYGGKIDNIFDRRLLNTFIQKLFSPNSFESDCELVNDNEGCVIIMPDAFKREQFVTWIENLKQNQQTPAWLGLPNSAEKVLLSNQSTEICNKLLKLSVLEEEEEELAYDPQKDQREAEIDAAESKVDSRPAWMKQLQKSVEVWLSLLPKELVPIKRTLENIKDPLFRYFEREINTGIILLQIVSCFKFNSIRKNNINSFLFLFFF